MAARKRHDDPQRPMLSLWEPPSSAGKPIGVLATTFTLDAALFEEECLARFAGVQCDPSRDGALYRIEREEKLADLICAAVVADIHHCGGRRSLRWDLIAARPAAGFMHAKISVLLWASHLRVIVGSANLTSEGYRRNQECAGVLDFPNLEVEPELIDPLLEFLRDILGTAASESARRARDLLSFVDTHVVRKAASPRGSGLRRQFAFVGPGRQDLFTQINQYLPGSRASVAHVVSPFFDPAERPFNADAEMWKQLRRSGRAELNLHVAGEFAPETGRWRLAVPDHVVRTVPTGRSDVVLNLRPIDVANIATDRKAERRPLHAKSITLLHSDWAAAVVGSSNFTAAGLGLNKRLTNYEANLCYWVREGDEGPIYKQLATSQLQGGKPVPIGAQIEFAPCTSDEDAEGQTTPPLPAFFETATLVESTPPKHRIALAFGPHPPRAWSLRAESVPVIDRLRWEAQGDPRSFEVDVVLDGPPPSFLKAEWLDADGTPRVADLPVNVATAAVLPPPAELRNLSLAALLELLSSARPLHEAMRNWLRRSVDDDDDPEAATELIDPHQKVDTSQFLIKRVQRACGALSVIRERLEQPVVSEAALAWRIDGPVGVRAVSEAMRKQCAQDLPDEWAFLLCELLHEVEGVRLRDFKGKAVPAELQMQFERLKADLAAELALVMAGASDPLRTYATARTGERQHETA